MIDFSKEVRFSIFFYQQWPSLYKYWKNIAHVKVGSVNVIDEWFLYIQIFCTLLYCTKPLWICQAETEIIQIREDTLHMIYSCVCMFIWQYSFFLIFLPTCIYEKSDHKTILWTYYNRGNRVMKVWQLQTSPTRHNLRLNPVTPSRVLRDRTRTFQVKQQIASTGASSWIGDTIIGLLHRCNCRNSHHRNLLDSINCME